MALLIRIHNVIQDKTILLVSIILISACVQGENVYITVLATKFWNIEIDKPVQVVQLQCYSKDAANAVTLEFGRTAPVPSASAPDPPPAELHPNPQEGKPMLVKFPSSNWDIDGFGAFYCKGSKSGLQDTMVSAVFTRSDAKFVASDTTYSRTVNVGDIGVAIAMTKRAEPEIHGADIAWRKNGGSSTNGSLTYMFPNPIHSTDDGIYEIHYLGERQLSRGSLYRLIVRGCPAGKWGPPDCYGVCDMCYNGGVCDDKTGQCICPNNFKGQHCLDVCRSNGGNRFGSDCEFRCSYGTNDKSKCAGILFCLPDPFGCSCDIGVKGIACVTACEFGEYGPGCSQSCHCASGTCNKYSGTCSGACAAGWSGDNCQIPFVCPSGYYGAECTDKCHCLNDAICDKTTGLCSNGQCAPGFEANIWPDSDCTECLGAFFGLNCEETCHCQESSCDKVTGSCNGSCLANWVEPHCQTGISRIEPQGKVNPIQPSTITCYVRGTPVPEDTDVALYLVSDGVFDSTGISRHSSAVNGSERPVAFILDQLTPGRFACVLGNFAAVYEVDISYYDLPVLTDPPTIVSVDLDTVHIQWTPWNPQCDVGDPPLVEYSIFISTSSQGDIWLESKVVEPTLTRTSVSGLEPDTEYLISIAAVREGNGGTGPRSPVANFSTPCQVPSPPKNVTVSGITSSSFTLTWRQGPRSNVICEVISFQIGYWSPLSSENDASIVKVGPETSEVTYTVNSLAPDIYFIVQVRSISRLGSSDWSEPYNVRTEDIATGILPWSLFGTVLALLVVIACVLVAYRLRLCRKQPKSSSQSTSENMAKKQSTSDYTNPVFSDKPPNARKDPNMSQTKTKKAEQECETPKDGAGSHYYTVE